MRDYALLAKTFRYCHEGKPCKNCPMHGNCPDIDGRKNAADAIEELLAAVRSVVHCKDCKWCHAGYCEKYDDLIPWGCANKPWEDWFCADGKRREIIKEAQDAD